MLGFFTPAKTANGNSKAKRIKWDFFIRGRKNNHLLKFSPEFPQEKNYSDYFATRMDLFPIRPIYLIGGLLEFLQLSDSR